MMKANNFLKKDQDLVLLIAYDVLKYPDFERASIVIAYVVDQHLPEILIFYFLIFCINIKKTNVGLKIDIVLIDIYLLYMTIIKVFLQFSK